MAQNWNVADLDPWMQEAFADGGKLGAFATQLGPLQQYFNENPEYAIHKDYSDLTVTDADGQAWRPIIGSLSDNTDQAATWVKAKAQPAPQVQQQPTPQPAYEDPAPVGPTIYDSMDDWINIARREDYGRQNIWPVGPGTIPGRTGYQSIPFDPALVMEMFYPSDKNTWRDQMRDPFKGGLLKDIVGTPSL